MEYFNPEINEDSNTRLGHCADLVNQISAFAHDVKPFKKGSSSLSSSRFASPFDAKPVAIGSDRLMWVKRRPNNERARAQLNTEQIKVQKFWMEGTRLEVGKQVQNKKTKNSTPQFAVNLQELS